MDFPDVVVSGVEFRCCGEVQKVVGKVDSVSCKKCKRIYAVQLMPAGRDVLTDSVPKWDQGLRVRAVKDTHEHTTSRDFPVPKGFVTTVEQDWGVLEYDKSTEVLVAVDLPEKEVRGRLKRIVAAVDRGALEICKETVEMGSV